MLKNIVLLRSRRTGESAWTRVNSARTLSVHGDFDEGDYILLRTFPQGHGIKITGQVEYELSTTVESVKVLHYVTGSKGCVTVGLK